MTDQTVIDALKRQFEALDATHCSAELAIARQILRDLDGYDVGSGWIEQDAGFLVHALIAYAAILQDHGVKV